MILVLSNETEMVVPKDHQVGQLTFFLITNV